MTDKELNKILKEFKTVRVEMLDEGAKRLFYAIMKIADERDELLKENQRLNNVLNELEKIIQSDAKIYCSSESAMKSFKSAERIYKTYLLNKLKELKESDK